MALVKYNNNSISAVTSASSIPSGALTHIKTLTASSSATLSFVDGSDGVVLDSTYPIYKFEFINMHPATNRQTFSFQGNAAGGSGYNETMTTTAFQVYNRENDGGAVLQYSAGSDQAQGTAFQILASDGIENDNDTAGSGYLHLYNPSSTTFVKHFTSFFNHPHASICIGTYVAGYFNTTSAIDAIQFKFNSGNIDSGSIKLYGIKDS